MRSDICPCYDDLMDEWRYADENWQDKALYAWEWEHALCLYNNSGLWKYLKLDDAQALLNELSARFGVLPVLLKSIDCSAGKSLFYYHAVDDVLYIAKGSTLNLDVIHEFTHYWLAVAFNFVLPKGCTSVLTHHGGVFVRGYIEILCDYFGLDLSNLMDSANGYPLHVFEGSVCNLWKTWLDMDFDVDGEEQRNVITALALLDVPEEVRA